MEKKELAAGAVRFLATSYRIGEAKGRAVPRLPMIWRLQAKLSRLLRLLRRQLVQKIRRRLKLPARAG